MSPVIVPPACRAIADVPVMETALTPVANVPVTVKVPDTLKAAATVMVPDAVKFGMVMATTGVNTLPVPLMVMFGGMVNVPPVAVKSPPQAKVPTVPFTVQAMDMLPVVVNV